MSDYGILMWGANITAANRGVRFTRLAGPGAASWTANLTIAAPAYIPDYIPSGDGDSHDLLLSLANAMSAADPNDDYTVALQSDSVTGMTGQIIITNTSGHQFRMDWDTAATTADPAWFGGYVDPNYLDVPVTVAFRPTATSTAGGVLTSSYHSSLVWAPQVPFWIQWREPSATASIQQVKTIGGQYVTRQLHRRNAKLSHVWGETRSLNFGSTLGGELRLMVSELGHDYIHVRDIHLDATLTTNRALEVWWFHASRGRWFMVIENNAAPGFGANTKSHFARLTRPEHLNRFESIAQKSSRYSPETWDVDFVCTVVDRADLQAAGG